MAQRNQARRRAQGFRPEPTESPATVPQAGVRIEPMEDGEDTARIGIYGDIGIEVTAEDVAAAVAQAKGKPLTVDIFSFGGDAAQGLAIHQILAAHDAEVTTNILGIAASAASVIFMAGDKRRAPVNSALMVHSPWSLTIGNANEHRKAAAALEGLRNAYLYTYSAATGLPTAEIEPYLDDEAWIYGLEAVDLGFATEAPEPLKAFASIKPPPSDRFRQMPDDLRALAGIQAPEAAVKVEVNVEVTDPSDPPEAPESEELEISGPPDAVLELLAKSEPENMTSLSTEHIAPGGHPVARLSMTETSEIREAARREERERAAAIRGMAAKHNLPGDFVDHLLNSEISVAEAREQVLDKIATTHTAATSGIANVGNGVGMSQPEAKAYSLQAVLNYLADPKPATASAAGYELEWAQEAQKHHARSAGGVLIPHEVFALSSRPVAIQRSDVFSTGGALVTSDRLDGSFIELVRNKSAFLSSGITTLNGLTGNVEIGRQTGASTTFWVGEDVAVAESDPTFGLVNMTPKTLGARIGISRRSLIQTSPDIENLNRNDMIAQITLGIDRAIGYGLGSAAQPLGIANLPTGVGSVTFSGGQTASFNANQGGGTGNAGTWAQYVLLETLVSNANLDVATMRYIMNSAMRGALKTTLRDSVAGADYIFRDNATVNSYQAVVSNQVQQNDVFFGDFSAGLAGFWSSIDLVVDPFSRSDRGQVIYTAFQDFDFAVRRPESFAIGT